MTGLSTLLPSGGLAPRLLVPPANAESRGSPDAGAATLDVAVADALARLRGGAIATWSDVPDADFAATLRRHDAAITGLAHAIGHGPADRRLQHIARRLAAAAAARQQTVGDWQIDAALVPLWVVSGSSVPIRFV